MPPIGLSQNGLTPIFGFDRILATFSQGMLELNWTSVLPMAKKGQIFFVTTLLQKIIIIQVLKKIFNYWKLLYC